MKPKTLVLMGVAITCGLGASYMTSRLLAERNTDDEPKVDVLVAKKNLNMGDILKNPEELFQIKKFIKGEEPPNALSDFEALRNRVLKQPRLVGDHITPDELFGDKDQRDFMAFVLSPGFRACGIPVSNVTGAFGFACAPLSRVDVIATIRRADDRATHSRVLLENVLVLAADGNMRRPDDGKPMPSQVVTLALKPEDVLKVRLAGELGSLSLALRKLNDTQKVENDMLTFADLKSGRPAIRSEDAPEPKPAVPPPAVASKPKVEPEPVVEAALLRKHTVVVSEGSKTRYFNYYFNENNEVVEPPAHADGADPKK